MESHVMTAANADRCIANSLVYEGGFTNLRADPGNWTGGKVGEGYLKGTNYGIAANSYPYLDIANLTKSDAIAIYKRDFWPKVAGDAMPKGVDQLAFDGGINSGPARGLRWIAAGAGISATVSAAGIAAAAAATPDKTVVIKKASAARLSFLHGLGTFGKFGAGWTRRVAGMEALAVKMALEAAGHTDVAGQLKKESKAASGDRSKAIAKGTATGGADVGAQQTVDPSAWDWISTGIFWLAIAAIAACSVYFLWQFWIHHQRTAAYADAASGKLEG